MQNPYVNVRISNVMGIECPHVSCNGCLPTLVLEPNSYYIISGWVKKEGVGRDVVDYGHVIGQRPYIKVSLTNGTIFPVIQDEFIYPSIEVPVVEGWQLISKSISTGDNPVEIKILLAVESGTALFDDVRIFPADGSMKCYVYDKTNLRFLAELDERHFATFYEYDAEGKLVRVKKETERGIMTIQETHQNASQAQP